MWIKKAEDKKRNCKKLSTLLMKYTDLLDNMETNLGNAAIMTEMELDDKLYDKAYDQVFKLMMAVGKAKEEAVRVSLEVDDIIL